MLLSISQRYILKAIYNLKQILYFPPANNGSNNRVQATTGIIKTSNNNQLKLYPNPNNGSMSIEYSLQKDSYLEITDISGTLVGKYNLPANVTKLDIQNYNLNNGVYLYRVVGEKVMTGKFVIMK